MTTASSERFHAAIHGSVFAVTPQPADSSADAEAELRRLPLGEALPQPARRLPMRILRRMIDEGEAVLLDERSIEVVAKRVAELELGVSVRGASSPAHKAAVERLILDLTSGRLLDASMVAKPAS